MQPNQMILSQKEKFFPEFFSLRLKSSLKFEHFLENDDPRS